MFILFKQKLFNQSVVSMIEKLDETDNDGNQVYGIVLWYGQNRETEKFKSIINRNARFDALCTIVGAEDTRGC